MIGNKLLVSGKGLSTVKVKRIKGQEEHQKNANSLKNINSAQFLFSVVFFFSPFLATNM